MIKDSLMMKGQLEILLFDKNNNLKQSVVVPNLVVATGRIYLATLLAQQSVTPMSHMAIGTNTIATNVADTTLGTEVQRAALASVTRQDNSVTYSATFLGSGQSRSIVEAGIFNNSTGGTMLCRSVFGVITKDVDDILTINWTVTVA